MLFDKYAGRMMALCNRYCTDKQRAQDILQDGFIRVFQYIDQYREEGSFEGWMRKIFVGVALREISREKIKYQELDPGFESEKSVEPDAVSRLTESEIHALIRGMPTGYRTVFNLHVIEGYSHEEIAGLLGIEASTSRVQLMKAKKHLQALLVKKNRMISHEQHI